LGEIDERHKERGGRNQTVKIVAAAESKLTGN